MVLPSLELSRGIPLTNKSFTSYEVDRVFGCSPPLPQVDRIRKKKRNFGYDGMPSRDSVPRRHVVRGLGLVGVRGVRGGRGGRADSSPAPRRTQSLRLVFTGI